MQSFSSALIVADYKPRKKMFIMWVGMNSKVYVDMIDTLNSIQTSFSQKIYFDNFNFLGLKAALRTSGSSSL